jgi:hypothetical protein
LEALTPTHNKNFAWRWLLLKITKYTPTNFLLGDGSHSSKLQAIPPNIDTKKT